MNISELIIINNKKSNTSQNTYILTFEIPHMVPPRHIFSASDIFVSSCLVSTDRAPVVWIEFPGRNRSEKGKAFLKLE